MKPEVIAMVQAELENQMRAHMGMEPAEDLDLQAPAPGNEAAAAPTTPENIDEDVRQQQKRRRRRLPESTSSSNSEQLRASLQAMVKQDPEEQPEE